MAVLLTERVERPASLFGLGPDATAAPGAARSAPGAERRRACDAARRTARDEGPGGGPTLDEAIVGAWEGLAAQAVVACPLCGGALRPHAAAATGELLGRCGDCGTTLA
jgi:hypothetical protein